MKSAGSAASAAGRDREAAKAAFQRKLDAEVLKVIAFYRARLVELQQVGMPSMAWHRGSSWLGWLLPCMPG